MAAHFGDKSAGLLGIFFVPGYVNFFRQVIFVKLIHNKVKHVCVFLARKIVLLVVRGKQISAVALRLLHYRSL